MEKRTETIGFKVSPTEKIEILTTLKELGFENKNDFLRSLVLDQVLQFNNGQPSIKLKVKKLETTIEELEDNIASLRQELNATELKLAKEISNSLKLQEEKDELIFKRFHKKRKR
jgi:hypothetical protein